MAFRRQIYQKSLTVFYNLFFNQTYCFLNYTRLLSSADKVYKKAVDGDVDNDEEIAYVFYMRYSNIILEVAKTTKYQADKVSLKFRILFIQLLVTSNNYS